MNRDRLLQLFTYDQGAGCFYRKSRGKKCRSAKTLSKPAGSSDNLGYVYIGIDGRKYACHHLVWLCEHGWMPSYLDHRDLDPSNNRIGNIRLSTHQQNCLNRGLRSDSQTGFKGVKKCPDGRFMVRIVVGGERRYLGLYDTAEEAAAIYDAAAREHHGEFANLNFPEKSCTPQHSST
jgi:hypothetical protein